MFLESELGNLGGIDRQGKQRQDDLSDWTKWAEVYPQLLAQGRIWDFHDLFISMVGFMSISGGTYEVLRAFLGTTVNHGIDKLVEDWSNTATEPDEGTHLALLDILSIAILDCARYVSGLPFAKHALGLGESIAASLVKHFPNSVKSRPFLLFSLAKVTLSTRSGKPNLILNGLLGGPGPTRWPATTPWKNCTLPYYIPLGNENPGLPRLETSPEQIRALEMILISAQHLQDYRLQTMALKEIILLSEDPCPLLDQLADLQNSTRNSTGYLTTCLTMYLVCRSVGERARLYQNLNEFGVWDDPASLSKPSRLFARDIIQRALSNNQSDDPHKNLSVAAKYWPYLGRELQELVRYYCPDRFGGESTTEKHPSGHVPPDAARPTRTTVTIEPTSSRRQKTVAVQPSWTATPSPQRAPIIIDNINRKYSSDTDGSSYSSRSDSDKRDRSGHAWQKRAIKEIREAVGSKTQTHDHRQIPSPAHFESVSEAESIEVRVRKVVTPRSNKWGSVYSEVQVSDGESVESNRRRANGQRSQPQRPPHTQRSNPRHGPTTAQVRTQRRGSDVHIDVDVAGALGREATSDLARVISTTVDSFLAQNKDGSKGVSRTEGGSRERKSRDRAESPATFGGPDVIPRGEERVSSWLRNNHSKSPPTTLSTHRRG